MVERNAKYVLDSAENKAFMKEIREGILNFGKHYAHEDGSSYYLGDDGTPWVERNRETWITSRMVHVYSIGAMMNYENGKELAAKGVSGLRGVLCDKEHGGYYPGVCADGTYLPTKQCYAHAFVILAGTSGVLAGVDGAKELLEDAMAAYDKFFWDESEGLAYDTWNSEFTVLDDYRGLNANMHTVEAFLAVADVLKREDYRVRAGRIIDHVLGWAKDNNYRLPEHYSSAWVPDLECNADKKDDQFKPYGATPGHGIEWSRLIIQWAYSTFKDEVTTKGAKYLEVASKLYRTAISDAYNSDGAPGIVYTTDWQGKPIVHDRMHWTLAEAINSSAVLYRITKKEEYLDDYYEFVRYLDECVLDHVHGSWYHQLNQNNEVIGTVWPGKSDLYHAFQATLIPYCDISLSIGEGVKEGKVS